MEKDVSQDVDGIRAFVTKLWIMMIVFSMLWEDMGQKFDWEYLTVVLLEGLFYGKPYREYLSGKG